jgi:chromosomal replication initiation ATPase DnaA
MSTVWDDILEQVRVNVEAEEFRRWFASTAYASDAVDQVTVWVASEAIRRHLTAHYQDRIDAALRAIGREHTHVRFLVAGFGDEDEEEDKDSG